MFYTALLRYIDLLYIIQQIDALLHINNTCIFIDKQIMIKVFSDIKLIARIL